MSFKESNIWKFFSSIKLAIWLFTIIASLSLAGTFIPQGEGADFYISKFGEYGYSLLVNTGLIDIYSSWWFLSFLFLFSLNLFVCTVNRFSLKSRAWGSFISHLSILLILLGALAGRIYGEKGYLKLGKGQELSSFDSRNKEVKLGFSIRLDEFIYQEQADAKEKLLVYPSKAGEFCNLSEDPHAKDAGLPMGQRPIALLPADIGVESRINDTGYSLKVLRYVADFVMDTASKEVISRSNNPNNPAVEVELKSIDGKSKSFWVFAHYPDMHQEMDMGFKIVYDWQMRKPKDFISKITILKNGREVLKKAIRVNDPLHFEEYTLFQYNYDNQAYAWTGLQIVKDPGVPLVYAGFVMLIIGLVLIFYLNPLMQRRA